MAERRTDTWAAAWLARRLAEHDVVSSASALSTNSIEVVRKRGDDVRLAAISVERLMGEELDAILEAEGPVDIVVNIKLDAVVSGDALELAKRRGIPVLGVGDVFRALNDEHPARHVPRETEYVGRILRQHTKVSSVTRLDNARYRLARVGLAPVTVLVLNEYDLTAEKVRKALDVYGDCDAIVTSNPNASMSSSAREAGEASGKRVLLFADLLSDLNRPWN